MISNGQELGEFRKKYFSHAMKSSLFENVLRTSGKIVFGKGCIKPRIVFVGEAPGREENKVGVPFVGRSGKLLDEWISFLGLTSNDFFVLNVVPIIPLDEKNGVRKPSVEEIDYFFPLTKEFLGLLKPRVIVLLGKSASSIFGVDLKVGEIVEQNGFELFFIYHPSYYLRRGGKGFENTLEELKIFLNKKIVKIKSKHNTKTKSNKKTTTKKPNTTKKQQQKNQIQKQNQTQKQQQKNQTQKQNTTKKLNTKTKHYKKN